jgi:hypothetical protein
MRVLREVFGNVVVILDINPDRATAEDLDRQERTTTVTPDREFV